MRQFIFITCSIFIALLSSATVNAELTTGIRQITFGPRHHFFGYIGHVRTVPWNESGRYIVALRTEFQDRMPTPSDTAEIVLLDTENDYAEKVVDRTRAWNPQQGTMLYWNPAAPETQFFFNDRDPQTNEVFCVLFDISQNKRIAEFRYDDTPIGNGGVAQRGGWFLGINYGRLARLRPVTGYPGAYDWAIGDLYTPDDGVFKVNVETREKQVLMSFAYLTDALRPTHPEVDKMELFINHTLWSRDDSHILFFVRGNFDKRPRIDVPFTMRADGSNLQPLAGHFGGHPEWESGHTLIGARGKDQILFDVETQQVVGTLGTPEIFPVPKADVALSPDGKWFVNGHSAKSKNYYTILRRADDAWTRTSPFNRGRYTSGDLRIDAAPCWNRDGTRIVVPALADDGTRQMFLIEVGEK